MSPHRYLFPQERYAVTMLRKRSNPNIQNRRAEQFLHDYGPEGVVIMGAIVGDRYCATAFGIAGLTMLTVSKAAGTLSIIGYCAMLGGLVFVGISLFRARQLYQVQQEIKARRSDAEWEARTRGPSGPTP